ncbi:DNA recombination protein RmuC [Ktedonobacter robiniae]|uniref:DNA recombination protein RmuC n=1 Tax=Ktedonobacter robiniae TaxID=2778365 RepID=A0ABQ3V2K7_9CHLR|nr:DNA recombination protein RmuC [Ktedonobacter robiniae]GHO59213.1 hypothetical protein KSB_76880 [Ktedonobacter robiniae]
MPLESIPSSIVGIGLASILTIFLVLVLVICLLVLRRVQTMQSNIAQLYTAHISTQASIEHLQTTTQQDIQRLQATTQQDIQQLQATTQQDIKQLQIAQASTSTMVSTTQQETRIFLQEIQAIQTLMQEVRTLQHNSQAFMNNWQKETSQLSRALRTNYQQGVWGERELRQVVELAGMIQHCDFDLKPRLPNGKVPDLVIHMHNNRSIAVDAKAPSQAYIDAMSCEDEKTRAIKLQEYARTVRDRMNDLAKKEYWQELESSLSLVILFLPNEAMFRAALEFDLQLLDVATQKNVLLASPITLIALLKAIAHGWCQELRAQNVQQIIDQSKVLHKELEGWVRQWQSLRKAVNDVTTEFNRVATSYETNILPLIKELSVLDGTATFKEKTFSIKVLRNQVKLLEEESEREEARENISFSGMITRSLEKLKDTLTLNFPYQAKEQESEPL